MLNRVVKKEPQEKVRFEQTQKDKKEQAIHRSGGKEI